MFNIIHAIVEYLIPPASLPVLAILGLAAAPLLRRRPTRSFE